MSMSDEPVLLSADRDGVRTLTLNRPIARTRSTRAVARAGRRVAAGRARPRVRALVITGRERGILFGRGHLSAGATNPSQHKLHKLTDVALAACTNSRCPTIAKVTGVAVGAGWNLALGCDFVVATPESHVLARSFRSADCRSISVGPGCCPSLSGFSRRNGWRCWPKRSTPAEAQLAGLGDVGQPRPTRSTRSSTISAARLAAGPALRAGADQGAAERRRRPRHCAMRWPTKPARRQCNFATADAPEAYAAFAEKRAPSFTGRWAVPAHARSTRGPRKEQTDA